MSWATSQQTSRYRYAGHLTADIELPYLISHQDLLLVGTLLRGAPFLAYLAQRARWSNEGNAAFMDEGELLDAFLDGSLPEAPSTDVPGGRVYAWRAWADGQLFEITSAGRQRGPEPLVDLRLRPEVRVLLDALENHQPRGWVLATLAILDRRLHENGVAEWLAMRAHESYLVRDPDVSVLVLANGEGRVGSLLADPRYLDAIRATARVPFAIVLTLPRNGPPHVTWCGDAHAGLVKRRPHRHLAPLDGELPSRDIIVAAERAKLRPEEQRSLRQLLAGRIARNQSCPCGSGAKWKLCHGVSA